MRSIILFRSVKLNNREIVEYISFEFIVYLIRNKLLIPLCYFTILLYHPVELVLTKILKSKGLDYRFEDRIIVKKIGYVQSTVTMLIIFTINYVFTYYVGNLLTLLITDVITAQVIAIFLGIITVVAIPITIEGKYLTISSFYVIDFNRYSFCSSMRSSYLNLVETWKEEKEGKYKYLKFAKSMSRNILSDLHVLSSDLLVKIIEQLPNYIIKYYGNNPRSKYVITEEDVDYFKNVIKPGIEIVLKSININSIEDVISACYTIHKLICEETMEK